MTIPPIAFTKYHGNGNDFIVFDLIDEAFVQVQEIICEKAQALCDRHRGIGGDGVIMVHKREGQWCIVVINADGSHARNCGNGLRVAARHITRMHRVLGPLSISFAGSKYLCAEVGDDIAVAMGLCTIRHVDELWPKTVQSAYGHIGNDHLIFLLEDGEDKYHHVLAYVQDKLANVNNFNIGFLWPDSAGNWISRVYERGVGFTQSCGTGAIVAASFLQARSLVSSPAIVICQPGGRLTVRATLAETGPDFASFDIVQQGNAREVFKGICLIDNN